MPSAGFDPDFGLDSDPDSAQDSGPGFDQDSAPEPDLDSGQESDLDSGQEFEQDTDADPDGPVSIKILVAGGFGAGKTTMVGSVSEIRPLRTEEILSEPSMLVDTLDGVEKKTTTTVAMDFGRITVRDDLVLYLFGTPGQHRFWFMWDELALGALGAVVMADTRRLADSFPSVDYFERRGLPFVVAVNCFDGARRFHPDAVRAALDLDPGVPVVLCDARQRSSSRDVLVTLVEYAISLISDNEVMSPI